MNLNVGVISLHSWSSGKRFYRMVHFVCVSTTSIHVLQGAMCCLMYNVHALLCVHVLHGVHVLQDAMCCLMYNVHGVHVLLGVHVLHGVHVLGCVPCAARCPVLPDVLML